MTFEEWYKSHGNEDGDWWKTWDKEIKEHWLKLSDCGVPDLMIADAFTTLVDAMRDQYGD